VTSVGFAPGKIILLGEHSVVFGKLALAASLPYGVTVRAEAATSGGIELWGNQIPDDPRVRQASALIAAAVGVQHARAHLSSELPPGGGLGSSAAFAVALTRALAGLSGFDLTEERLSKIGLASEQLFHGKPSGVDHTVSALGGLLRFWKGPPPRSSPVQARLPIPLVVALTGQKRDTGQHVLSLVQRAAEDPATFDPLIDRLGVLAEEGTLDVEAGDFERLGPKMNEAHELLSRCGVSSESLDAIVKAARGAGALGAKLTGAGGGGAAIALAPNPEPVIRAIQAAGYAARVAIIGGPEAQS
jgi:mevalonate kinase